MRDIFSLSDQRLRSEWYIGCSNCTSSCILRLIHAFWYTRADDEQLNFFFSFFNQRRKKCNNWLNTDNRSEIFNILFEKDAGFYWRLTDEGISSLPHNLCKNGMMLLWYCGDFGDKESLFPLGWQLKRGCF